MSEYTARAFAKRTGISVVTLWRWDREGKLAAHRRANDRPYYTEEQVSAVATLRRPRSSDDPAALEKACIECGVVLPVERFARRRDRKGGRAGICKTCKDAYDVIYRERNTERINEKNRRWWSSHSDKAEAIRERRRPKAHLYWRLHREELLATSREYHRAHTAEISARKRRWGQENRELVRASSRRRRTRKRAAGLLGGHHTEEEWREKLAAHEGQCAMCGTRERVTRDHIVPLSRGGTDLIENIQPLCVSCNSRKGRTLPLLSEAAT